MFSLVIECLQLLMVLESAFHLRGPFKRGRFDEFSGSVRVSLGLPTTFADKFNVPSAQQPIPHGLFRLDGEPQDVLGRVHVSVVDGAAAWARPGSHVQRHLEHPMAAAMTGLAGRRPAIHDDRLATVPLGLVLDLPPELAHAHVGYGAGDGGSSPSPSRLGLPGR